jgi:hypothetical protein
MSNACSAFPQLPYGRLDGTSLSGHGKTPWKPGSTLPQSLDLFQGV